jgi:uncharacterized membrane protein YecN with MAPEG domain
MQPPTITAAYVAILALLHAALGLRVVRLRGRNRAAFGDGGNADLRGAIRAHGHFAEYVPIISLMAAMLEISGAPAMTLHAPMGALVAARLLHPFGMNAQPQTWRFRIFRVGGMTITITVMVSLALLILRRSLFGG